MLLKLPEKILNFSQGLSSMSVQMRSIALFLSSIPFLLRRTRKILSDHTIYTKTKSITLLAVSELIDIEKNIDRDSTNNPTILSKTPFVYWFQFFILTSRTFSGKLMWQLFILLTLQLVVPWDAPLFRLAPKVVTLPGTLLLAHFVAVIRLRFFPSVLEQII